MGLYIDPLFTASSILSSLPNFQGHSRKIGKDGGQGSGEVGGGRRYVANHGDNFFFEFVLKITHYILFPTFYSNT